MLNIYADESCRTAHRYLVLGGIVVEEPDEKLAILKFKDIRDKHKTYGEIKWEKVSKGKLPFYQDIAKTFFELNKKDILHFHSLCVDTHTFAKGHDPEMSFDKLMYQLLLHKFGRKYGDGEKLYAHLDERTAAQSPDFMRPMLNADLRKRGIANNPFKRIRFIRSHASELIQANDLLIGAIGSRKNGNHLKPGANSAKVALGEYISAAARDTTTFPILITSRFAKRFSLWNFQYSDRS